MIICYFFIEEKDKDKSAQMRDEALSILNLLKVVGILFSSNY